MHQREGAVLSVSLVFRSVEWSIAKLHNPGPHYMWHLLKEIKYANPHALEKKW